MAWRVFGERFETSDFTAPYRVYQPIKFASLTSKNVRVKAIRTWFIVYNNPTFTSISLKIYSSRSGTPGSLLYTSSNSITKSQLITEDNGPKECFFEFDQPFAVDGNKQYVIVPVLTGYTGDDTSHVAWRRAFPDVVYDDNLTLTYVKLGVAPFLVSSVVGEEF